VTNKIILLEEVETKEFHFFSKPSVLAFTLGISKTKSESAIRTRKIAILEGKFKGEWIVSKVPKGAQGKNTIFWEEPKIEAEVENKQKIKRCACGCKARVFGKNLWTFNCYHKDLTGKKDISERNYISQDVNIYPKVKQ